ncbi:hypothetical protein QE152_g10152 [Popillia japonica]|uniref:Uncharacterized protein n=1 Tax=Popillia japonica TaxID=7064 RepID=A0AAW1LW87_POPJA
MRRVIRLKWIFYLSPKEKRVTEGKKNHHGGLRNGYNRNDNDSTVLLTVDNNNSSARNRRERPETSSLNILTYRTGTYPAQRLKTPSLSQRKYSRRMLPLLPLSKGYNGTLRCRERRLRAR